MLIGALNNARVVTPTETIEGASVILEEGRIAGIRRGAEYGRRDTLNVDGRYVLPGLVDLHSDDIERHASPRPNTSFAPELIFLEADRYFAWSGITTGFHAICFYDSPEGLSSVRRTIARAQSLYDLLATFGEHGQVRHELHLRCEVSQPEAVRAVIARAGAGPARLISLMDHTPGSGQMRNVEMLARIWRSIGWTETRIEAVLNDARTNGPRVQAAREAVAAVARVHGLVLASHDDEYTEKVDRLCDLGVRLCEFPITIAAARRAKERGMLVAMGAPNVVRGGSSTASNHLSATEAIRQSLVDVLVSDYHVPSLLQAPFILARTGVLSLPIAVQFVTARPAAATGLTNRGAIQEGSVADLIVVGERLGTPFITQTLVEGRVITSTET